MGERRVRNAEVVGSTPICSTNFSAFAVSFHDIAKVPNQAHPDSSGCRAREDGEGESAPSRTPMATNKPIAMPPAPRAKPGLPAVIEPPGRGQIVPAIERRPRRKLEPLWYVILHDDQLHSYQYVIEMLAKLFEMSARRAFVHAVEVDTQGVTIVARLPKDKAEDKRDGIMGYGGDPWMKTSVSMRASIEPCDD